MRSKKYKSPAILILSQYKGLKGYMLSKKLMLGLNKFNFLTKTIKAKQLNDHNNIRRIIERVAKRDESVTIIYDKQSYTDPTYMPMALVLSSLALSGQIEIWLYDRVLEQHSDEPMEFLKLDMHDTRMLKKLWKHIRA